GLASSHVLAGVDAEFPLLLERPVGVLDGDARGLVTLGERASDSHRLVARDQLAPRRGFAVFDDAPRVADSAHAIDMSAEHPSPPSRKIVRVAPWATPRLQSRFRQKNGRIAGASGQFAGGKP